MKINDRVYGEIEITEPVLIELINSSPLQRLKGINQSGASQYAKKGKDISRYEHSIGVMILLKLLCASVEEQIAGLLHDTPHTAFSHVIDYVFKEKNDKHEFHEQFHDQIILQSEIPKILKQYNYNLTRILNEHNFPLLEQDLPNLCADRVDYTLREYVASYQTTKEEIKKYLDSLIVNNEEIIIDNKDNALKFAELYLKLEKENWSDPFEVALFQILADAIKIALNEKILSHDDLFKDDIYVYKKLNKSKNEEIMEKLKMLNPNLEILDDPKEFHFHSRNKLRFVDPKFKKTDGTISRVTNVFKKFKKELEEHKEFVKRGNYIKIVSY